MPKITGSITDSATGEPVPARVQVLVSTGETVHPPDAILKVGPGAPFFYADGAFEVEAPQDGRPSGAALPAIDLSVVRGVGSSTVVPGSVGSYWPVIAGAKLREGTTTILPRGRALQGVGLSSMRFHPTGGGPKTTKMDKKHGSRQETHPLLDRPEIDWPCRTRISCHHLVWTAH